MPRVKKQIAAKDYPDQGIQKGDTYFKWSFRYGGTVKSKTYPRPSQLTQSKHSNVYAILENLQDLCIDDKATLEDITAMLTDGAEEIRGTGEEYNEADEAMGGHQGVNYERGENCEQLASEMDELADEFNDTDHGPDETYANAEEVLDALKDQCGGLEYQEV